MVSYKILLYFKLYSNGSNIIDDVVVDGPILYGCNLSGDRLSMAPMVEIVLQKILVGSKLCLNGSNNIDAGVFFLIQFTSLRLLLVPCYSMFEI